jgi:3-dehydroquinate dehydratase-2
VHLSDVQAREQWRRVSVLEDGCIATISGKGVDGYRDALQALKAQLGE